MLLALILISCLTSIDSITFGRIIPEPIVLENRFVTEKYDDAVIIGPSDKIPRNYSKYFSFDDQNNLVVNTAGVTIQFVFALREKNVYFEIPYTQKLKNCDGVITIYADGLFPANKKGDFVDSTLWFFTSSLYRLRGAIQINGRWAMTSVPMLFREFEPGWKLVCRLGFDEYSRVLTCSVYAGQYIQSQYYTTLLSPFNLMRPIPGYLQCYNTISGLIFTPLMASGSSISTTTTVPTSSTTFSTTSSGLVIKGLLSTQNVYYDAD